MGRKLDVDHLVGTNEVARLLGMANPQTVHHYKTHDPTFPQPVVVLGGNQRTHIWYRPEIERWGRRNGRLPKVTRQDPAVDDSPGG